MSPLQAVPIDAILVSDPDRLGSEHVIYPKGEDKWTIAGAYISLTLFATPMYTREGLNLRDAIIPPTMIWAAIYVFNDARDVKNGVEVIDYFVTSHLELGDYGIFLNLPGNRTLFIARTEKGLRLYWRRTNISNFSNYAEVLDSGEVKIASTRSLDDDDVRQILPFVVSLLGASPSARIIRQRVRPDEIRL